MNVFICKFIGKINLDGIQDGGVGGRAVIFSCENSKITTCCYTTVDRRMLDPRRGPRKMVEGVKSLLDSDTIPARDAPRAQTNLVSTKTQRPHRD